MSPKDQIMAIAAAIGWKNLKWIGDEGVSDPFVGVYADDPNPNRLSRRIKVPDYLRYLNCSWEFESAISSEGLKEKYLCRLHEEVKNDGKICWKVSEADHFLCATAPAAARARAFLKAMDLWVEGGA